jgi:hypothetical protein
VEIDLGKARATVQELADALAALDGEEVDEALTRAGQRQRVRVNQTLQRLDHLARKTSVEVMDVFWALKPHDTRRGDRDPE